MEGRLRRQRDKAVLLEQLQPASGVACDGHRFEVDGGVPVVRLSVDQREDGFEDLVGDSDGCQLVTSSQA